MEIPPNFIELNESRGELPWLALSLTTISALLGFYCFKHILQNFRKHLPPGRLGFPVIGETISYIKAVKQDRVYEWVKTRRSKYGPVFKTSLMGAKTVVITGSAGNRFILGGSDNGIVNHLPASALLVIGKKSLSALSGPAHKPVRAAIMSFLKPESIQRFVDIMNSLIQQELVEELSGKDSLCVAPLMRKITFKVSSSLLFGLRGAKELDELLKSYAIVLNGAWSFPINIPGTSFAKAMKARARIFRYFSGLVEEKKRMFEAGEFIAPQDDVISKFISENFSDEEIFDNIISLMIAGHETTSAVVTLCMWQLGRDSAIFKEVLREQKEVAKVKKENGGGEIRWSEIQMMKYTWRFALEVMRLIPPVTGTFKLAERNTSFGGFVIPKGWQVLWAAHSTHMDENIFKDPEKFDPTRFENASGIPPYSYVPFGAGPRVCPGSEYGRIQVLLILHYMLTNYHWEKECPNEPIERAGMPYPAMGLPIKIRPRKL